MTRPLRLALLALSLVYLQSINYKSGADAQTDLKPGASFDILDKAAYRISDNAATDELQQVRQQLFTINHEQEYKRA